MVPERTFKVLAQAQEIDSVGSVRPESTSLDLALVAAPIVLGASINPILGSHPVTPAHQVIVFFLGMLSL